MSASEADRLVEDLVKDRDLLLRWRSVLAKTLDVNPIDAELVVKDFLKENHYNTTFSAIKLAQGRAEQFNLSSWACSYNLFVDNKPAGTLNIKKIEDPNSVDKTRAKCVVEYTSAPATISNTSREGDATPVQAVVLQKTKYSKNRLTWDATDGNPNSGDLTFTVATNAGKVKLNLADYVGLQFTGFLIPQGATKPAEPNVLGRVNQHNVDPAQPEKHDTLSTWAHTYTCTVGGGDKWDPGHAFVIEGTTVSFEGSSITKYAFTQNVLSWSEADNDTNGSLRFAYVAVPTKGKPYAGPSFVGKIWGRGENMPADPNVVGHLPPKAGEPAPSGVWEDIKKFFSGFWPSSFWDLVNKVVMVLMLKHMLTGSGSTVEQGKKIQKNKAEKGDEWTEDEGKEDVETFKQTRKAAMEANTELGDMARVLENSRGPTEESDPLLETLDGSSIDGYGSLLSEQEMIFKFDSDWDYLFPDATLLPAIRDGSLDEAEALAEQEQELAREKAEAEASNAELQAEAKAKEEKFTEESRNLENEGELKEGEIVTEEPFFV